MARHPARPTLRERGRTVTGMDEFDRAVLERIASGDSVERRAVEHAIQAALRYIGELERERERVGSTEG